MKLFRFNTDLHARNQIKDVVDRLDHVAPPWGPQRHNTIPGLAVEVAGLGAIIGAITSRLASLERNVADHDAELGQLRCKHCYCKETPFMATYPPGTVQCCLCKKVGESPAHQTGIKFSGIPQHKFGTAYCEHQCAFHYPLKGNE